jgi:hypothetical protein
VAEGTHTDSGADNINAVKSLLDQNISSGLIEICRLGKFVPTASKPRPILLRFASVAQKHAAFKKAKALRETCKARLDDDLTSLQRERRKARLPQAMELQQAGWTTFWRGDNLSKLKPGGSPIKVQSSQPPSASSPESNLAQA